MDADRESSNAQCRHDLLPVVVEAVEAPGAGTLLRWNSDNLELLHMVAACEEASREIREDHGAIGTELARIDARLRLALRLLGRLTSSALPAACEVAIGISTFEWRGPLPAEPGRHALASVWLSPQVPEALRLPGRLRAVAAGGEGWSALDYEGLAGPVADALAKHVFLHHRRSIALARPTATTR
jgi:hypothetical protein